MNDYDKMQKIIKWLGTLSDAELKKIDDELHPTIDREFIIETVEDHCSNDDDLFNKLFDKARNIPDN